MVHRGKINIVLDDIKDVLGDAGEEGLVFLFEQVLLLAGSMWAFLCLAPILNCVKKNLVKTLWIPRLKLVVQVCSALAN